MDEGWYVGRFKEVPGVMSQGETLAELEDNIRDAYHLLQQDAQPDSGFLARSRVPIHVMPRAVPLKNATVPCKLANKIASFH